MPSDQDAVDHCTIALELRCEIGDTKGAAQKQADLGNMYRCLGQYELAIDNLQRGVASSHELGDSSAEKTGLENLSYAYRALGQHRECLEVLLRHAALNGGSTRRVEQHYAGCAARICDLRSKPELNGQQVEMIAFNPEAGRVGIKLPDGTSLSVKPVNLTVDENVRAGVAIALDNAVTWAESLRMRGMKCLERGDIDGALQLYDACRAEARLAGDQLAAKREEGYALAAVCQARGFLGQWERATEAANESLSAFQAIGDTDGQTVARKLILMLASHPSTPHPSTRSDPSATHADAQQQLEIACQYADNGEMDTAKALFRQLVNTTDDPGVRKAALGSLASGLAQHKDFVGAAETFSEVIAICQSLGHEKSESVAHLELANALVALGELERASIHFDGALQLSRKNDRPGMEAKVLCSMGQASREAGQYTEALNNFTQAHTLSSRVGDDEARMEAHSGLGAVHAYLCHYPEAVEHHEAALALSRSLTHRGMEVVSLSNLGGVYIGMNRSEDAQQLLEQCVALCRSGGDHRALCSALTMLGKCERNRGNVQKAIVYHRSAVSMAREAQELRAEANAISDLVDALTEAECFEEALEEIEQSPHIDGAAEGMQLLVRGRAQCSLGQLEVGLESFRRGASIHHATGDIQQEAICLSNIGSTHVLLGQPEDAVKAFESSAAAFERIWQGLRTDFDRVKYGDSIAPTVFQKLQWAHFEAGRVEESLIWAERSRAQSLEVLLARQHQANDTASCSLSTSPIALSVQHFRDAADRYQIAIIFYSLLDRCGFADGPMLLIWAIGREGRLRSRAVQIDSSATSFSALIEEACSECHVTTRHLQRDLAAIADEETSHDVPTQTGVSTSTVHPLRRCYQLLIEPVEAELISEANLLIIPDMVLYKLPFAALLSRDSTFLIEKHSLRVAFSLRTIFTTVTAAQPSSTVASALVVGDPLLDPRIYKKLKQLPGALAEADQVQVLLSRRCDERVTYLTREHATKTAVIAAMRNCSYIHMATHGTHDALMLAGGDEGKLSMAEVQHLSLQPHSLVVLSACKTFDGTLSSDGVMGIARAFLAAGASSLLASLWPVDDFATRILMERFYERMLTDDGDTAAALQGAMVSMLSEGARFTVAQWASFVVYGGLQHTLPTANDDISDADELAAAIALSLAPEEAASSEGDNMSKGETAVALPEAAAEIAGHADALILLRKLLTNVVNAPHEPKYRQLRSSNPKLKPLLSLAGGWIALRAVGFVQEAEHLRLPMESSITAAQELLAMVDRLVALPPVVTPALPHSSDGAALLRELCPSYSQDAIEAALHDCSGDVQAAALVLLGDSWG